MTNELQIFNYQSNEVRVVEQDGEPWFVAKDVCAGVRVCKDGKSVKTACRRRG